jgi:cyclic-di-AMP phosphodiesterase
MDNKKFLSSFVPRASFYLWVIFILVAAITYFNWRISIPGYLILIILVYYNFRSNHLRQREITKYIENLTFNIDTATKDTLLNFPMPLVVIQLDGTIIWYNSSFRKIFEGEDLLEKTISSFVQDLHPENLISENMNISKDIEINDRHYCVLGNFVKVEEKNNPNEYILLLYLVDNTDLVELRKKYSDEKVAVGAIVIDNYDDLMQSMEDASRPQMLAEIERKMSQWVSFTGGILKKFERDKYLFVFETKNLKEFEEKNTKF